MIQNLFKENLCFALTLVLFPPVVVVDEEDVYGDRGVDEEGHGRQLQNFADLTLGPVRLYFNVNLNLKMVCFLQLFDLGTSSVVKQCSFFSTLRLQWGKRQHSDGGKKSR